ncbi:sensor domain-containing diguanylate cyclase [Alteromonas sp. D210916BOD_24]|uniref:sensor domain-containing diguanylate cyclase n=1 Tax=Alteromonas sp. D210916BOD_24 TaxID=3157618 RepID=UPI00399C681C
MAIFERAVEDCFRLSIANELFAEATGVPTRTAKGNNLAAIFPQHITTPMRDACSRALETKLSQQFTLAESQCETNHCWNGFVAPCINNDNGHQRVMVTLVRSTENTTLVKAVTKTESRYEAIVTNAYEGIISIDEDQNILLANNAAKKIFGTNELEGKPLSNLIPAAFRHKHPEYVQSFKNAEVASRPMHLRASVMGVKANGQQVPLEITIAKINVDGKTEMTAFIRDITEKNQLIDELNHISHTDSLTALNNRRYLESVLLREFERAVRYGTSLSILFVDIDNFKNFNDRYSHLVGDMVLKKVAGIFQKSLRDSDIACRWGGEEFVVLLPESDIKDASLLAERLREAVENFSFVHEGVTHKITISVGVAGLKEQHQTPNEMLQDADDAMLDAKKGGKNKVITR